MVTNEFYPTGLLRRTFGPRTYPVGYAYDAQGRLVRMTNWSGFNANSGARITTWNYNAYRGWLDNKRYPDATGPDYTSPTRAGWPHARGRGARRA